MAFIKKHLFFSFILFCSLLFAQEQTDYSQLPFDDIRDSINTHIYSNLPKAVKASNAYINKAKKEKDKRKEWLGIEALGNSYLNHRELDNSQEQFEKALQFAEENEFDEFIIRSYILGAQIQLGAPNASKALAYLNKALAHAEKTNNDYWKENVLMFISSILQMSGEAEKAIEIKKSSIKHYKNKPLDSTFTEERKNDMLLYSYSVLSNAYLKVDQVDSAKQYVALMDNLISEKDSCKLRTLLNARAEIYFYEKKYVSAKENFRKASQLCNIDMPLMDLQITYDLGKVAHGQGNFQEAINLFQRGLDNYEVTPAEEGYMDDYYKLLADSYKETGDFERANYYFEKYITSTSEFNKIKNDIKESTRAQEIKEFRNELESLESEKNKKETYLNYLFLGASVIILILLFFLLRFYKTKKENEAKFETLLAKINIAEKPEDIIDTKDEDLDEKNTTDVPEETKQQILDGLKKLENQEYFLKQDCNSYNVAKKINTNTSYLSKVINSHFGKNFNTYINDLRINYTIVRLKNDVIFRSYSIQAIAEEVGYKSADSFTKYFKRDTGLNPSFYIKELKNIT
ncbi:tetratricopeptide repeat protein [Marixanthomonas sp. SCSIO 43207]|uniref:tetratricopeptide repeat protein n=1 Tax=Marixanthomonas sp. SCSIO 43207 TaxID=2779360 RepID=UPI001CA880A4|nr:tetratricopeptide repeat protein [Marixanthomonas sp. SCSIO 43207]UAB81844.1 tetratricopeptide repeat protein [Marixanthomonas sp. SCSIO 43207]